MTSSSEASCVCCGADLGRVKVRNKQKPNPETFLCPAWELGPVFAFFLLHFPLFMTYANQVIQQVSPHPALLLLCCRPPVRTLMPFISYSFYGLSTWESVIWAESFVPLFWQTRRYSWPYGAQGSIILFWCIYLILKWTYGRWLAKWTTIKCNIYTLTITIAV